MATHRENSRDALLGAAVRLIARRGVKAATVRSIARAAGVTEAAVYRHYASKEELYLDAYTRLIAGMTEAKQAIASSDATFGEKLREWVRVSYEFFDGHADAFTFVFLTPHDLPEAEAEITTAQGRLLLNLIERAQNVGEMAPMCNRLAASHFIGLMLNVPRSINEGLLEGPASKYVDNVTEAIYRALAVKD
jgi:AcrR family transcriptional regulator